MNKTILYSNSRGWDKSPSLSIVFGLSSKTQWLSGLCYTDFISFYSPTQLCGGGTTKSNSNELPISVPLSFVFEKETKRFRICLRVRRSLPWNQVFRAKKPILCYNGENTNVWRKTCQSKITNQILRWKQPMISPLQT